MVIRNIHDRIADGESLNNAFAAHADVFSELTISVLRAGSEGAFLEDALRRVGGFLERQAELKGKVLGALIYPIILLLAGITVFVALLIVLVPMFEDIIELVKEQEREIPLITQSLFGLRSVMLDYGLFIVGIVVVLLIWIQGQLSTQWGKRLWDRFKLQLPLVGSILLDGAVARFCRVFGTLLTNGVPILKSLEISGQSAGNSVLSDAIRRSAENVSSGEPLAKPLAEAGIIPPQVMAMIGVAEESNTLETVLVNTADSIERHSARKLDMLVRILEPAMLLLMGLMVLYFILALFLPLFIMWDSLQ